MYEEALFCPNDLQAVSDHHIRKSVEEIENYDPDYLLLVTEIYFIVSLPIGHLAHLRATSLQTS